MATMKDVARRAGVSVATVSCCLSGRKNVRPETRLRIEQAVHDLKYVPNPSAQRLKGTRSRTVGAIMPDFNEQLFSGIFKGISEYFQGHRFLSLIHILYTVPPPAACAASIAAWNARWFCRALAPTAAP